MKPKKLFQIFTSYYVNRSLLSNTPSENYTFIPEINSQKAKLKPCRCYLLVKAHCTMIFIRHSLNRILPDTASLPAPFSVI